MSSDATAPGHAHYNPIKYYKHYNVGLISCIAHVLTIGGAEPSGGFSVTPWFRLYTRSRIEKQRNPNGDENP